MAQSREIIASSVKQPLDTRRAESRSTRHHKRTTTVEFVTHCLPCAVATMALRHYPHCGRRIVIVETSVCRDADETSAVFRDEGVSGEEAWRGRRGRGRRRGRRGGEGVSWSFSLPVDLVWWTTGRFTIFPSCASLVLKQKPPATPSDGQQACLA